MNKKQPTPLQASFWLTDQEKVYILIVSTIFLIGLVARYYYLKNDKAAVYTPVGVEEMESPHE
jgi:hypothetical protein